MAAHTKYSVHSVGCGCIPSNGHLNRGLVDPVVVDSVVSSVVVIVEKTVLVDIVVGATVVESESVLPGPRPGPPGYCLWNSEIQQSELHLLTKIPILAIGQNVSSGNVHKLVRESKCSSELHS